MDRFCNEYFAMRKRVREGIAIEKRRKKRAEDSYQCYLVYMKRRKQL